MKKEPTSVFVWLNDSEEKIEGHYKTLADAVAAIEREDATDAVVYEVVAYYTVDAPEEPQFEARKGRLVDLLALAG